MTEGTKRDYKSTMMLQRRHQDLQNLRRGSAFLSTRPPKKSKVVKEEKDKNGDMNSRVGKGEKDKNRDMNSKVGKEEKVKNRDEPIRFQMQSHVSCGKHYEQSCEDCPKNPNRPNSTEPRYLGEW